MARILYPILTDPVLTAAQRPEQVTESRWHQPFSEPVRRVALTTAVIVASGAIAPVQMPPPTDTLGWRTELSQPTRARVKAAVSETFAPVFTPVASVETVTVDKWLSPFNQPTRRITWVTGPELAEPAFVPPLSFAWYEDLAQPTRRIAEVANKPAYTAPAFVPPLSFAWFKELAQPTYRRAEVANKPAFTAPTFVPPLSFAWYGNLTQPTRAIVSVAAQPSFVIGRSDTATDARWFTPLSEPTRRNATVQPDALSWSEFTPVNATGNATRIFSDWFNQLQLPTRAIWSPTGMVFTWLPPSGEAGVTPPPTTPPVVGGGPAFPYPKYPRVGRGRRLKDICEELERETTIVIPADVSEFAGEYFGPQIEELEAAIAAFVAEQRAGQEQLAAERDIAVLVHAEALLRRLRDEEEMCALLLLTHH